MISSFSLHFSFVGIRERRRIPSEKKSIGWRNFTFCLWCTETLCSGSSSEAVIFCDESGWAVRDVIFMLGGVWIYLSSPASEVLHRHGSFWDSHVDMDALSPLFWDVSGSRSGFRLIFVIIAVILISRIMWYVGVWAFIHGVIFQTQTLSCVFKFACRYFLVTVPAVLQAGTKTQFCAVLQEPSEFVIMSVYLKSETGSKSLLRKGTRNSFIKCFSFHVSSYYFWSVFNP